MFAFTSVAVGTAAAMLLAVGAPAARAVTAVNYAASSAVDGQASSDWSGWDVTGDTYTSVSASWTVPSVTCSTDETSYSADWVGLDGDGSDSVEQTGTSSDCDSGTASYSAWYEFYPSVSVSLLNTVKAGDKISASVVAVSGTDEFKLVLTDSTQKWTKTETGESPSGTGASAEIIAEAPSGSDRGNSVLPLADFKKVSFSDVLVNAKKVGDLANASKIAMVDNAGSPMATVSALTDSKDFTVTWVSSGDSASAALASTGQSGLGGQSGTGGTGGSSPGGSGRPQSGGGYGYGGGSDGYGSGSVSGWGDSGGWGYAHGDGSGSGSADGYGYGSADGYGYTLGSFWDLAESLDQA